MSKTTIAKFVVSTFVAQKVAKFGMRKVINHTSLTADDLMFHVNITACLVVGALIAYQLSPLTNSLVDYAIETAQDLKN